MKQWIKQAFPGVVRLYRRARYGQAEFAWDRKRHTEEVFTDIFERNVWMDPHSASGEGSNLEQTEVLRRELPSLLQRLGARTMLDAPCGDFFWMKEVNLGLEHYFGADIVGELINRNQQKYASDTRTFMKRDLIRDALPRVDVIFCRDCLVHLSYSGIRTALANFKASGATWLLTTTFPARDGNSDIPTGKWRPLNLQLRPFNFPEPVELINERCPAENGAWADKSLAAWRLDQVG